MFLNPLVDFIYYQFGLISKGPVIAVCETSVDLPFRCVIFWVDVKEVKSKLPILFFFNDIFSRLAQQNLHDIRNNVVVLLTALLPQLDLNGISLETADVDNILQQIIEVNSLKLWKSLLRSSCSHASLS